MHVCIMIITQTRTCLPACMHACTNACSESTPAIDVSVLNVYVCMCMKERASIPASDHTVLDAQIFVIHTPLHTLHHLACKARVPRYGQGRGGDKGEGEEDGAEGNRKR